MYLVNFSFLKYRKRLDNLSPFHSDSELSKNPDVEKKLLQEIESELRDGPLTYEKVKSLKYANAVFHETLRLHPSVPKNIKQAVKDHILPDGTKVNKGCMVVWSPYVMGRTEAIWGPDATRFKPERWIETEKPFTVYEYPSFHAGPRICLGRNLAELEGVFVLVSLIKKFKIERDVSRKVTYANSLTLPMRGGLWVKVSTR